MSGDVDGKGTERERARLMGRGIYAVFCGGVGGVCVFSAMR